MDIDTKTYRRIRQVRILVSAAVAIAIFAAVALGYDLWLCRWQLAPAVFAGSLTWIALWLAVTAVAGRVYCSAVCPAGALLDLFGWLGHRKRGYFFSTPREMMRRTITAIAVVALLVGIPVMFDYLEPASAFSRLAAWGVAPLVRPVAFSLGAGIVAFATLGALVATAMARGRIICNTICPVGAVLAEVARFSVYHMDVNTDKCIGCGRCVERCKAECIDPSSHTVDQARCVMCFNCVAACSNSAITYRRGRHRLVMPMMQTADSSRTNIEQPDQTTYDSNAPRKLDRRKFIASLLTGAPLAALAAATAPNPDIESLNPVHPPGLRSIDSLRLLCTACGACSAACPSGIIRPGGDKVKILRSPLRPMLEFETGFCRYDCVRCTEVCPTDTLVPLTPSEKHIFVIGKARVVPQFCSEYTTGEGCGICARRCPRRAITIAPVELPEASPGHPASRTELLPSGRPRRLPQVDIELCIGCGACRYYCPSSQRAFIIEGNA